MSRIKYTPKPKICLSPSCENKFIPQRIGQKHCGKKCYYQDQPKQVKRSRIRPVSAKRAKQLVQYNKDKREFLNKPENKYCKIEGTECLRIATTIEHTAGRRHDQYYDDEARQKGISLLLDKRLWLPCCWNCNPELENNTELSEKHQLSKHHQGKKIKK